MSLTNFPAGVTSFGVPVTGSGIPANVGAYIWVSTSGSPRAGGTGPEDAFSTISAAVSAASSNSTILVAPGTYNEAVSIPRTKSNLTIVGLGGNGSVSIAPSTVGAKALSFDCDDLTLVNIDLAGETTATSSMIGTGSRLRAYSCKIEGSDTSGACVTLGPGSVVQVAAGTKGKSGDNKFYNCELAWGYNGFNFLASDYGVPTQVELVDCLIHNVSNTHFFGTPGAFGIGSVRNLVATRVVCDNAEDGTKPADYININTAFDTGIFSDCSFALATNAAADLKIGAGIKWVANKTEAGVSVARPS